MEKIFDPAFQRNAFLEEPENLPLIMLYEKWPHVRELELRWIIEARNNVNAGVRRFKVLKLNCNGEDYTNFIIWDESQITPPLMLNKVNDNELKDQV